MKLVYPAIFDPWEEGNGFTVEFPDLPGCTTEGSDLAEALYMAQDAAAGWVLGELEDGKPTPAPTAVGRVSCSPGQFVNLVPLDIDAYAEKYGSKAVRKNLTIPAWLNTFAEQRHVNFSQVLTDALTTMYYQA